MYQSVRNFYGVVDLEDYLSVFQMKGRQALAAFERLIPSTIGGLQDQKAMIIPILDNTISLLGVVHLIKVDDETLYLLCPNEAIEEVVPFLTEQAQELGFSDADFSLSKRADTVLLSSEGPSAWQSLSDVFREGTAGLKYFDVLPLETIKYSGYCIKQSFFGEHGYLLMFDVQSAKCFKSKLLIPTFAWNDEAAEVLARESGGWIWGKTVLPQECPMTVGLGYLLDFDKEDYIFFEELIKKRKEIHSKVVGFKVKQEEGALKAVPSIGDCLFFLDNEERLGKVRGVNYSMELSSYIGSAEINKHFCYPDLVLRTKHGHIVETHAIPFLETKSVQALF